MKKFVICFLFGLLLISCSQKDYYSWDYYYEPETNEERIALQQFELRAINAIRIKSLAGHDQDWDDTLAKIHDNAIEIICIKRLYEYKNGSRTGKWKYFEEEK